MAAVEAQVAADALPEYVEDEPERAGVVRATSETVVVMGRDGAGEGRDAAPRLAPGTSVPATRLG
jgi:hypothetical protein